MSRSPAPDPAGTAYLVAVGLCALPRRYRGGDAAPDPGAHMLKAADSLNTDIEDAEVVPVDDPSSLPAEKLINTRQAASMLGLTDVT
jgi:hypothetical protein